MSAEHTLLLIQFDENEPHSRTYLDFDSVSDAMDAIAQIYENKLSDEKKKELAAAGEATDDLVDVNYDMRGLVAFLDAHFYDIVCMVFDETQKIYVPHGKEWIKSRLYTYLKKYIQKEKPKE